jgi:hypothetical protein
MAARTVVGYIGANGLNNMASTSPTGSVEALTGLPIGTGLDVGQFQEFSASEAKKYSYTTPTSAYPWGQLYDGTYCWVQLDPTVTTDPIPLGTAVSWLASAEDGVAQKQVTTFNSTSNADVAGFSVDSNFGKTHPYAFIQLNGKVNALFDATAATAFGDVIGLSTGTQGAVTRQGASSQALTGLSVGISLVGTGTASTRNLIRVNRTVARF